MENAQQDTKSPLIYLNNAATTWPKPAGVLEEVADCLRQPFYEPGRTTGDGSINYPSAAREVLTTFFHAGPPEHFIFTQNATDSLNLLIHGFVKKIRKGCQLFLPRFQLGKCAREDFPKNLPVFPANWFGAVSEIENEKNQL